MISFLLSSKIERFQLGVCVMFMFYLLYYNLNAFLIRIHTLNILYGIKIALQKSPAIIATKKGHQKTEKIWNSRTVGCLLHSSLYRLYFLFSPGAARRFKFRITARVAYRRFVKAGLVSSGAWKSRDFPQASA